MKAIILAAGLGTRFRPMTDTIPKCLLPIDGRPLLSIWLDHLRSQGVDEVLINTHWLAGQVEE
ncbi:MAG: NTP transferase domain-containing protein, partial [Magnetococcales bacterium]|nr:NTP transferase domain-containing protein [Magnetococcales bacterium]